MSRDADDVIVSRAKTGDPSAWRELYVANAGRLTLWLSSLRLLADDPEDLAAEAWLTAASKINDFQGDASDFAGWLFGIARNLALNAGRRAARRGTSPYAVDDDADMWGATRDLSEEVAGRDQTQWLLGLLPKREAEVVACIDVVGLDVASTATALGISATAVRVARHRALGRLRKILPARRQLGARNAGPIGTGASTGGGGGI